MAIQNKKKEAHYIQHYNVITSCILNLLNILFKYID